MLRLIHLLSLGYLTGLMCFVAFGATAFPPAVTEKAYEPRITIAAKPVPMIYDRFALVR